MASRELRVKMTKIAGPPNCDSNDCPTVYTTDRDTVAVQGYTVSYPTPEGESVVEIPREILLEAARALGR